ncbi:MAG: DNA translocase FtsK [Pseudomonadota bacterium]
MTYMPLTHTPEQAQQAGDLVVRLNAVSVSLLQRHFRMQYSTALGLVHVLEKAGFVTAPGADGFRSLTQRAAARRPAAPAATARELCEAWACDLFEGGDGGDAGSPETPSIWLFGMEHGDAVNLVQEEAIGRGVRDYSVAKQLIYPFNRNAFKLFAAIEGRPVESYVQFAREHQPWVPGARGYFKGNLYPYPCRNLGTWSEQAQRDTGFERKQELVKWCREHRLPAIAQAVQLHKPRLFIGVGSMMADEFAQACFGRSVPLALHEFTVNGRSKKLRYAVHNGTVLVVVPHISSGSNGLNSDESLHTAGSFIADLLG